MMLVGLGAAGIGALGAPSFAALAQDRPLTPTFYQWIIDLHPGVQDVNKDFKDLNFQIAPVQGFVLTMAVMYVLLNLVIDILYGVIDPRVRVEG